MRAWKEAFLWDQFAAVETMMFQYLQTEAELVSAETEASRIFLYSSLHLKVVTARGVVQAEFPAFVRRKCSEDEPDKLPLLKGP